MYNNYIYIILAISVMVIMLCNCQKGTVENMTNLPYISETNDPIVEQPKYEYIGKLVHLYTRDKAAFINEGQWTSEYFKTINIDDIDTISIPPGTDFYLETYEPVCPKCERSYHIKVPYSQTTYYTIILDMNFKLKINNIKNLSIKSL